MEIENVIVYFLIYLVILVVFVIRDRKLQLNATTVIILLYTISAIGSIYFYENSGYDYRNITIPPFLYLITLNFLLFIPVVSFDNNKAIRAVSTTSDLEKTLRYFVYFLIAVSILPFLETLIRVPAALTNSTGLAEAYEDRAEGKQVEYLSWISRKFNFILILTKDIVPVLFFYFLIIYKRLNKPLIVGLIFVMLTSVLNSFVVGARSGIMQLILYNVFLYALTRRFIHPKRRKVIEYSGGTLLFFLFLFILIITIARFDSMDSQSTLLTWISLYVGEGALNFNVDLWKVDEVANGNSVFILPKYLFGLVDDSSIDAIRSSRDVLKVRNNVFYTWVGTVYYDLNKMGTFFFAIFLSGFFYKITKVTSVVNLSQFVYLGILGKMIMIGPMFYPYSLYNSQLTLGVTFLFGGWIWYMLRRQNRKSYKLIGKKAQWRRK